MFKALLNKGPVARFWDEARRKASWKMLGVFAIAGLVVFTGCAKSGGTTTTGTVATTTTTAVTAVTTTTTTSKPAPTTTVATTATAKPAPAGAYGELRFALSTFGQETFEVPLINGVASQLTNPMYDWMFWADKGEFTPGIVERWELAPDALSRTYYVRKGVKFHDGSTLTAKDVKFSIEQFMRKDASFNHSRTMVARVDLMDEYTLKIHTIGKQPYLQNMQSMPGNTQGVVMPKDYTESKGWAYVRDHPMGSGPWKFVRHLTGDMVEYEAVDKHWRATPSFKKMTIVVMPEEATRLASIRTGALDIAEVSLDSLPGLQKDKFQLATIDRVGIGSYIYGAFDTRAAKMAISDVRVRRALAISINRDEIMKNFFNGLGGPPMAIQTTESTTEIDVEYWKKYFTDLYKYDPDEAKRLLKEAGYADGFPIKLYAYPISGTPWLPQLSDVLAAYWNRVGIKAQVVPLDYGTYQSWRKPLAEGLVGQHAFMRFPSGNDAIKGLESVFGLKGLNSLLGTAYPDIEKLIVDIYGEMDPAKRKVMLAELIKKTHATYVAFQIASGPNSLVTGPGIDLSGWTVPLANPYFTQWAADVRHK